MDGRFNHNCRRVRGETLRRIKLRSPFKGFVNFLLLHGGLFEPTSLLLSLRRVSASGLCGLAQLSQIYISQIRIARHLVNPLLPRGIKLGRTVRIIYRALGPISPQSLRLGTLRPCAALRSWNKVTYSTAGSIAIAAQSEARLCGELNRCSHRAQVKVMKLVPLLSCI
jgi:hypothetical protein